MFACVEEAVSFYISILKEKSDSKIIMLYFNLCGSKKLNIHHILWFLTLIFIHLVSPALYTPLFKIISHFVYMCVCVRRQYCKSTPVAENLIIAY